MVKSFPPPRVFRVAVITDLHHGLAPDALQRLDAFVTEVHRRKNIDLILQLGDLCYSDELSKPCLERIQKLKVPKIQVLGNHDMDKCDKEVAMKSWGMKSRFGSEVHHGFTFVYLDLNHFKKDGALIPYAKGNYFTDHATYNWADPDQLKWLQSTLENTKYPAILLSHQPLGFAEPGQKIPPEQQEILDIILTAKQKNPAGAVCLSLFGHLHVDRLEHVEGIPFICMNSASYFWSSGMWPYSKPLFAFLEFGPKGSLMIEGVQGEFEKAPPASSENVIGRSASIMNRKELLKTD